MVEGSVFLKQRDRLGRVIGHKELAASDIHKLSHGDVYIQFIDDNDPDGWDLLLGRDLDLRPWTQPKGASVREESSVARTDEPVEIDRVDEPGYPMPKISKKVRKKLKQQARADAAEQRVREIVREELDDYTGRLVTQINTYQGAQKI